MTTLHFFAGDLKFCKVALIWSFATFRPSVSKVTYAGL